MVQVVRLPGGITTLQDAADAFLDDHDLACSTQRVYRASRPPSAAGRAVAGGDQQRSGGVGADPKLRNQLAIAFIDRLARSVVL